MSEKQCANCDHSFAIENNIFQCRESPPRVFSINEYKGQTDGVNRYGVGFTQRFPRVAGDVCCGKWIKQEGE